MYSVVGASGNTGRAAAEALLAAGKDVQVIGRSTDHLKPLVAKGAEAFVGSVEDPQAMTLAFSGAVGVYCLIPMRADARDLRAYQKSIGESLAAAIHEAGVEHVVFLSSVGAQHVEGTGPIVGLREVEDRLNALAKVNVLSLRPGWFMENFFMVMDTIRQMDVLGTPVRGDVPIMPIATQDIGVYGAQRLVSLDFSGKSSQELLGAATITMEDATRALGAAIGKPDLPYVQIPYEDFGQAMLKMGISESAAAVATEMYRAINDGLIVPEEERSAENTTPTTIEEFAKVFAQVYNG
jgi:uncharacterized protein YbjT (DUF2867 family)